MPWLISVQKFVLTCIIFDQCSTYVETRQLVITSKMFEKHQLKSDILVKDTGHSSTGVFQRICQEKPTAWFMRKWDIGPKWVKLLLKGILRGISTSQFNSCKAKYSC